MSLLWLVSLVGDVIQVGTTTPSKDQGVSINSIIATPLTVQSMNTYNCRTFIQLVAMWAAIAQTLPYDLPVGEEPCLCVASLAFDRSTNHTRRWCVKAEGTTGNAMRSQVCLFPCAMIPEASCPFQMLLFSSVSSANRRHCSDVSSFLHFECFFFFFLVILPNQTAFYKEPSNQSNGWQLSLRPPLISNRLGSKISTEHANQHHNQPVTEVGSKLILLSFIIMTYNYPHNHTFMNTV